MAERDSILVRIDVKITLVYGVKRYEAAQLCFAGEAQIATATAKPIHR